MVKKIKRTADYQFSLEITNPEFLKTPRDSQKTWVLNRLMKEISDDITHLNAVSSHLLRGADSTVAFDREQSALADSDIMEDWQIPIMKVMAQYVASDGGDVLEIGMGRGIASDFIQQHAPRSHTLVECNDDIVSRFGQWSSQYPESVVSMVHGMWQDKLHELTTYDGILFHTYPLTTEEFVEQVVQSATFAEHFFKPASDMLKPGGVLTYLTNENDSISRAHQRSLLQHFSSFSISLLDKLEIPEDTRDSCWLPQMVMIKAVK